ncbi:MAG: hypothetical protein QOH97_1267 [Actinoplanes sp.]|jgi:hypothetical protein|nr:hypothetical protein [Actinoplanes sp.]
MRQKLRPRFSFRQSMRFGPLEVAAVLGSVALIGGGLLTGWAEKSAHDRLVHQGSCVIAEVIDSSSFTSQTLGRSAHLSYVVNGNRYVAQLHYDAHDQWAAGTAVPVCVENGEPRTFVVPEDSWSGESTNLWLERVISIPMGLVGLLMLLIFVMLHQWRFYDGDETPTVRWGRPQRSARHLSSSTSPLAIGRDIAVLVAIGSVGAVLTHVISGQDWTSPTNIGITSSVFLAAVGVRLMTTLCGHIRRVRASPPVDPADHHRPSKPDD